MISRFAPRKIGYTFLLVFAACFALPAQTFQIGQPAAQSPQAKKPGPAASKPAQGRAAPSQPAQAPQLGFGSNIQDARIARAAELALQQGHHGDAVRLAQRAVQSTPNNAQLWILLGYAARLNHQYGLSVDAYNHGLRLEPGSVEAKSGLAQTYAVMGRTDEAIRILKELTASGGRASDVQLLGELTLRTGDAEGALGYFRRAEQMHPDMRSELMMALCYQRLKQPDLAKRYLNMAKGRSPNNPEVQRTLAGFYLESGSYAEAVAALQEIKNPGPDVLAEMGYAYQLDGKQAESARAYTKAADARPRDITLQLSAAQAELSAGAIDKANHFLDRASAIDPEHYRLHAIRGQIDRQDDRNEDALKEYQTVLAHMPANPSEGPLFPVSMHLTVADLYQSLGQPDEAHAQLDIANQQINTLNENSTDRLAFLRLRATIRMRRNDLDGASADIKEALAINPKDLNTLQLDGDLLMKEGNAEEAVNAYQQILTQDPKNRFALTSMGYAQRAAGRNDLAERSFRRLAEVAPDSYVPYAALGDLYTSRKDYGKAEASYEKAYKLAPKNALVVAGGMNADIEAHKLDAAGLWMKRATPAMQREPQVLREEERYLSFRGDYEQSASIAEKAIKVLPKDRDVIVYYGYDLLNLKRYDDLLKLTSEYRDVLPNEPDIPLLAGYVHTHNGQLQEARADFTEVLARDPDVVTAYVNRGYILHDLRESKASAADFGEALKREPNNGEAHLGLAYANLDMRKSQAALEQADIAQKLLGDSEAIHLIKGTAYGQRHQLLRAADEYRAALKYSPNDASLHLALANILYSMRRYHDSIDELNIALRLAPNDAATYALLARTYAQLGDRAQTMQNVELAEKNAAAMPVKANQPGSGPASIYLATGSALSILGDQNAAMDRYSKALETPGTDRMNVRLAIAHVMVTRGDEDGARRQIALAQMESVTGESEPPTGDQLIQAADVFRSLHDYELSQKYLDRAEAAGASDTAVRIGRANNDMALGDTERAKLELNGISKEAQADPDYQLLLAQANVFRQEHNNAQALTTYAQAANAAGDDPTAENSLLMAGANEGLRINPTVSLLGNFSVDPIFEATTVYVLDSKLDTLTPIPPTDTAALPLPRSSIETQGTAAYHLHLDHLPTVSGFFQVRNARGTISVPATNSIANRNTTDYNFNVGLSPTVRIGRDMLAFDGGVQGTIRRDSISPAALDQNLYRLFLYMNTTSFFDAISVNGYVIRDAGPFTETSLHSRILAGGLDFKVGRPWGRTALITGWSANDQQFQPENVVNFYTSSYVGLQHRFGENWNAKAMAEDLRTWRIVGDRYAIAQALRPAGEVDFSPAKHWQVQASATYNNTRGFHVYDAVQSGFAVSYAMPFHRNYRDVNGDDLPVQYPIRFSAGMQQESFFNFPGKDSQQYRPYFSINLF